MNRIRTIREPPQPYHLKGITQTGKIFGRGSLFQVAEVIHAGAHCAAKIVSEGLAGHQEMIRKIERECHIMSSLRHPNIVQFLGMCSFERKLALVMEGLDTDLEALLTQTANISTPVQTMILLDAAKGLVYLHSLSPPVIHCDLTANSILLTNTLVAKIGCFGNSQVIKSDDASLIRFPGTISCYMPPEAMVTNTPCLYNEKLDTFSFGHLALYTALQKPPSQLLDVHYDPKKPNKRHMRTEVERRHQYIDSLTMKFGSDHTFTKLVKECLRDHPQMRPSAVQVLQQLQKLHKEHMQGNQIPRLSLNDYIHMTKEMVKQPRKMLTLIERIKNGGIEFLEKKAGKGGWKRYVFQISKLALKYFSRVDKKPEGEVPLDTISAVNHLDDESEPYQFAVIIEGKILWKLKASSEEERYCWMTAIKPNVSLPSAKRKFSDLQGEEAGAILLTEGSKDIDQQYQYQQLGQRNESQPYASVQPTNIPKQSGYPGHQRRDSQYSSGINVDQDQIQLLVEAALERALDNRRDSKLPEEIYPEVDNTAYATHSTSIWEESRHSYEDIDEYMRPGKDQVRGVSPIPLARTYTRKKQDEAIRKSVSYEHLTKEEVSDISSNVVAKGGDDSQLPGEYVVCHPAKPADADSLKPGPGIVKADDPSIPTEELEQQALYISPDSISQRQKIGEGQFGRIFKAVLKKDYGRKFEVAIKTIKEKKEENRFMHEIAIMSRLVHPNIIKFHGVIREENCMVLQYLPNGDLKNFLTKNQRPIESLIKYMEDVAMGMVFLCEKGLIHRDLAARNIMVDDKEVCKIADFGLFREISDYSFTSMYISSNTTQCPLRWMAPESIEHRKFSSASDVWSYGILLWEMFNPTELPYSDLDDVKFVIRVVQGYTPRIPSQCPRTVEKIMKECWDLVPKKRPTFERISFLLTHY